jgi:hypothetical protein
VLTDMLLFTARLGLLLLLLINLIYVFFPGAEITKEKRTEQLIEHCILAISGLVGLAVLQFV